MPLSVETRYQLEKRLPDWPFKGKIGDFEGDFAPDFAEWLMLAQVYEADFFEGIPVPYLAELRYPLYDQLKPHDGESEKDRAARQIQVLIIDRLNNGKSFTDLLLKGWVYQFSRKNEGEPTVDEIAKLMGISRDTFYQRGHTAQELHKAYLTATGKFKQGLPDPDGLDPVQRANRNARKPTFASLQRDLYSDD
jgi:hypothetical protein